MWCPKCGSKTTVTDTRTSEDIDSDTTRVRKTLLSLGSEVQEHCLSGKTGFRLRLRHCPECSNDIATVELTEAQFKEATKI